MKKIKKLLTFSLTIILLLSVCLCFTGCGVDPYYLDTWYLVSYTDENGNWYSVGYDDITATHLYSDDITIQYFENKTFVFKEFDKEFTGTYTYKKKSNKTFVTLTFSDGTKGSGTCAKYMFDGTWYVGTLQAFGKEYNFSGEWAEQYGKWENSYMDVGKNILTMLQKGETKNGYFSGYSTLYKGVVELRGGEYWFVPCNLKDINEQNLSQAYELYTYEVGGDYFVQRGDSILREGECFINYNFYRTELGSESFETRNRYAVWYYGDVVKNIYPWTVDLAQEEILSVRAEYRENNHSYYNVQIWEQGSEQLQEFYELFLNQKIVAKTPLMDSVYSTMTYHVKVADQTHTVVLQNGRMDDAGCLGFFVNGQFYRIYDNETLKWYFDSDDYYALEKDEESAEFFIGEQYVKSYNNLLEDILFDFDYHYEGKTSSDYILKAGGNTLVVLDERHFIWQNITWGNKYCEIVGDIDFSEIFEEYPLIN